MLEDIETTGVDQAPDDNAKDEDKDAEVSDSNQDISLAKLIAHVDQLHPRNENAENFKYCRSLGSYKNPYFSIPCMKEEPITELAKELGIGPAMFLISLK